MKTAEEVFDDLEVTLRPYCDIIRDLELFKLSDHQISNVLMLIQTYRFNNALNKCNGGCDGA
jgi:hypothetical protein